VESAEELARELAAKRLERSMEQQALTDTLALLNRVEEQQRANPDTEGRWERRIGYLKDVLDELRGRIASMDASMRDIEKLLRDSTAPSHGAEPIVFPRREDPGLPELRRLAAERVVGAPLTKLDAVPLEDYVLARSFLSSDDASAWPSVRREDLRRRIGIYDRRAERDRLQTKPRPTVEERRQQVLLRNVLDKCRAQKYSALTLGEIDLLIHSCDLLVQHRVPHEDEDRLIDIVNKAVDEICLRWSKLESIRNTLRPKQ
jgi:hypothetical protein